MMNRGKQVMLISICTFFLNGCEYFERWLPQTKKPEKVATVQPIAKPPTVEDERAELLQEITALELEKQELEQRKDEIQGEKETLAELLKESEMELRIKEREVMQLEPPHLKK